MRGKASMIQGHLCVTCENWEQSSEAIWRKSYPHWRSKNYKGPEKSTLALFKEEEEQQYDCSIEIKGNISRRRVPKCGAGKDLERHYQQWKGLMILLWGKWEAIWSTGVTWSDDFQGESLWLQGKNRLYRNMRGKRRDPWEKSLWAAESRPVVLFLT